MRLASVFKAVTSVFIVSAALAITGCSGSPEKVLVFSPEPNREQIAGVPWVPFNVRIVDVRGEPQSDGGVNVTISLKTGTGTLLGTVTETTEGGVAVFDNVVYQLAEPIVVDITAPGARPILDIPVTIVPNVPAQLAFATPPASPVAAGVVWNDFTVELRDAYGNRINDSQPVSLSVVSPPATGILSGPTTVNAVLGVATFQGLSYNVAEDITLKAESADLVATISLSVTVNPDPDGPYTLKFIQQPANGTTDTQQTIQVAVVDQFENIVTGTANPAASTAAISLSLVQDNPDVPTLACTGCVTVNAVDGVATFPNVKINRPAIGYTLNAAVTAPFAHSIDSNAFTLTHGTATQLVWVDPGSSTDRSPQTTQTAGSVWTPVAGASVAVFALDQDGNLTTSNNSTAVTIQRQSVPVDAAFVSNTVTVAGGVAAFPAVTYNTSSALPITVQATSGTLAPTSLVNITVNHGPAASLTFTTQPAATNADSQQTVTITVRDAQGNITTSDATPVALNFTPATGNPCGGTFVSLTGGGLVVPTLGVASFVFQLDKVCPNYRLRATSGVLPVVDSDTFAITHGAATNLNFAVQPGTVDADARQLVQVEIRDQFSNRVTSDSATVVTLAIQNNAGVPVAGSLINSSGATIPSIAVSVNSGLAKYEQTGSGDNAVQISRRGTGYTLVASATVLAGSINTVSGSFDVTPGAAKKLTFSPIVSPAAAGDVIAAAQPVNGTTGTAQAPVVKILDQFNNTVLTDNTTQVTVSIASGPAGAFCLNCVPVTMTQGAANFAGGEEFRLSKPGTYTLTATAGLAGVATATSSPVAITVGAPHHLKYSTAPLSQVTASRQWDSFTVRIVDEFGNHATTATGSIDLTNLTSVPPARGGECPTGLYTGICGTTTRAAVGGQASFTDIFYNAAEIVTMGVSCATCAVDVAANGLATDTTSDSSLSTPVNTTIDVRPDVVDRLAFVPANSPAAVTQSVGSPWNTFEVRVEDSHGNVIPTSRVIEVQVVSGCQNSAANFLDTVNAPPNSFKRTAVLGVASFEGIQANCAGQVVITAASGALAAADPITVTVDPDVVDSYLFLTQPIDQQVTQTENIQVAVIDQFGNIVTTDNTTSVQVDILGGTGNPAGDCFSGCAPTTHTVVAGIADIGFQIDLVGNGYVMTATDPFAAVTTAASVAFDLEPGDPFFVSFADASGTSYEPQGIQRTDQVFSSLQNPSPVTAFVRDQFGNLCTQIDSADSIFVEINNTSGSSANGGFENNSRRVNGGVAQFPALAFRTTNITMDVVADSDDVPNPSATIAVQVQSGVTSRLSFINQPNEGAELYADASKPVQIEALDAYGNRVTTRQGDDISSATLDMLFFQNPAGGQFAVGAFPTPTVASLTQPLASGLATFPLWINKSGSNYRVQVRDQNLQVSVISDTFSNVNGEVASVVISEPSPFPSIVSSTETFSITARLLDQWGNLVSQTPAAVIPANQESQNVNLAINQFDFNCTTCGGPVTNVNVAATNGLAVFSSVNVPTEDVNYFFTATAQLTGETVNSATFNVQSGDPSQIEFVIGPQNVTVDETQEDQNLGNPIRVLVRDANGNPVDDPVVVTLRLEPDPLGNRCINCGSDTTDPSGYAEFPNLQVNTPGTGYTLVASVSIFGISSATSATFNVGVGAAQDVLFETFPANRQVAGQTWTTFTAKTVDQFGNLVTGNSPDIDVVATSVPGGGALLSAPGALTRTVNPATGLATFSINTSTRIFATVSGTYTIHLESTNPAVLNNSPDYDVEVQGDIPDRIFVDVSNISGGNAPVAGNLWNDFTVEIRDAYNNIVPTSRDVTVQLVQFTNDNPIGLYDFTQLPTLSPLIPTAACEGGIATFGPAATTPYSIAALEAGTFRIKATSGSLGAGYGNVTVNPAAATGLEFVQIPDNATADDFQQVQVAIVDGFGNVVFTDSDDITLTTTPGATIDGGGPVSTILGVATFSVRIRDPFNGYLLNASGATYTGPFQMDVLDAFDITAGAPVAVDFANVINTGLAVTTALSPGLGVAVNIEDQWGNLVTTSTSPVALSITGGTPGAIFVGPTGLPVSGTTTAVAGVATFPNVHINRDGVAYQLNASSTGLVSDTSSAFDLVPGASNKLAVTAGPTSPVAADVNQSISVEIQDVFGNAAGTAANGTALSLVTTPANGCCGPLAGVSVDDAATFNFQVTAPGTYTATISSVGLTAVTSGVFTVTHGSPDALVWVDQPANATADANQTVRVRLVDIHGNTITSPVAETVSLSFNTNPGAATLTGGSATTFASGVAVFPSVNVNRTGVGYILDAVTAPGGFAAPAGTAFNITHGAASKVAFNTVPTSPIAADVGQALEVRVLDQNDNVVTTGAASTASISLSIGNDPSGGTAQVLYNPAATVAGVANLTAVRITKVGTNYTLLATSAGLASGVSAPITIDPGTPSQLSFGVQPQNTTADLSQILTVSLLDTYGNLVTTATDDVDLTIAPVANPGSTTLNPSDPYTIAAVGGVATFPNVNIDTAANGYRLLASLNLSPAVNVLSNSFNISAGVPDHLIWVSQPVTTTADLTQSVAVEIRDANDNIVTSATNPVSLTLDTSFADLFVNSSVPVLSGGEARTPVNGVVVFPAVSVDKVGIDYELTALSASLADPDENSSSFDITHGFRDQLSFYYGPDDNGDTCAGPSSQPAGTQSMDLCLLDQHGNLITSGSGATGLVVTLAYSVNAGGSTAANLNPSQTTFGGIATFANRLINKAGVGYVLRAFSGGGIDDGYSQAFDIDPAAPAELRFVTQPVATTTDEVFEVSVAATDIYGNVDTTGSSDATLAGDVYLTKPIGPGAADLDGGCVASAPDLYTCETGTPGPMVPTTVSAGVAHFQSVRIKRNGTHRLTATDDSASLTSANSNQFVVSPGVPYEPEILTTMVSLGTWTPDTARQIQVRILDEQGNLVTTATNNVTLSISAYTDAATAIDPLSQRSVSPQILTGGGSILPVSGVATFTAVGLNSTGEYDLVATAFGATVPNSNVETYQVTPGIARSLEIVTSVLDGDTDTDLQDPDPIEVLVLDGQGNHVYTATTPVRMTFGNNAGGATLAGAGPIAATNGVAGFTNLRVNKTGTDYTLVATATLTNPSSSPSNPFDVTAGAENRIAFTVQPQNGTVDSLQTIAVAVRDAASNLVDTATQDIQLSIFSGPGSCVSGCGTQTSVAGIATFTNVQVDTPGIYVLQATDVSGSPVPNPTAFSSSFTVTFGLPNQLAFTAQPSNATADQTQVVQVSVQDQFGNPVTTATNQVTLSFQTNPSSTLLIGGGTVTAIGGVASFTAVAVRDDDTGYELLATSPGLSSDISNSFDITAGAASKLRYSTGFPLPASANAGAALTAFEVEVTDAYNNLVTSSSAAINLQVTTGPTGGSIYAGASANAAGGIANFAATVIRKSGTYTLTATSSGLTSTPASGDLVISPLAPTQLVFATQPVNGTVDNEISIRVETRDIYGNLSAPTAGETADLVVSTGPQACGVASPNVLNCFTTESLDNGFIEWSFQPTQTGTYRMTTTDTAGLTNANSSAFTMSAGNPAQVTFLSGPADTAADQTQAVQVGIGDQYGNIVSAGNYPVTLTKSACTGTLSGGGVVVTSAGVATFPTVGLTTAQLGCTLAASTPAIGGAAISAAFDIDPGTPASVSFSVQPTDETAGVAIAPAIEAELYDTYGNFCDNDSSTQVSLEFANNAGAGTLSGTLTDTAAAGVLSWANISINKTGADYTLRARKVGSPSFVSDPSDAFDITAAAATVLAFVNQPAAATTDTVQTIQVAARDAFGNTDTAFVTSITLTEVLGPGSLQPGNPSVTPVSGIATFTGATGVRVGGAAPSIGTHRLQADDGVAGLVAVNSSDFSVTAGNPASMAFTTNPAASYTADQYFPLVVELRDSYGNAASGTNSVAIAIDPLCLSNGATLTGGSAVQAVAGQASFTAVNVNKANAPATDYCLRATSTGLTSAQSTTFDITAGAASSLVFSSVVPDGTTDAGGIGSFTVEARDAYGNTATGVAGNAQLSFSTNPGSSTIQGGGTAAFASGVATFAALNVSRTGSGYVLRASHATLPSITSATSNPFNVTAGVVTNLQFVSAPAVLQTAGSTFSTASGSGFVTVGLFDADGNLTSTSGTVIDISATPGSVANGGFSFNSASTSNGIATFTAVRFGTATSLTAVTAAENPSAGYTDATTSNITVNAGAASKLAFGTQPPATFAADTAGFPVTVQIQDAQGNLVTSSSANVQLSLTGGTGSLQGAGASPVPTIGGIASWVAGTNAVSINRPGTYRVLANAAGLSQAVSNQFDLCHGDAFSTDIYVGPSNVTTDITQPVSVRILDVFGNQVTGAACGGTGADSSTTMSLRQGVTPLDTDVSGTSCNTGCTTTAAVAGEVTFNVRVDDVNSNYFVRSSIGAGTADDDNSGYFGISNGDADNVIVAPDISAVTTDATQTVTVTVRDFFNNPVLTSGTATTLVIQTNPGTSQFVQAAPSTVLLGTSLSANTSSAGVATYSVRLSETGNHVLRGTNTATADFDDSGIYDVTNGASSYLAFTTQPSASSAAGANFAQSPQVTVYDALGNVAETDTARNVTLAFGVNAGGGTLTVATNPDDTDNLGVADDFGNISVNKTGTGYTLVASSSGVTSATSDTFDITPGAANKLLFTVAPNASQTAGATWNAVTVSVLDANDNLVPAGVANNVTLTETGTGAFTGSFGPVNVTGSTTFNAFSYNTAEAFTVSTSNTSGLTNVTAVNVTVGHAAATALAFTTQPASQASGGDNTGTEARQTVAVTVQDAYGNTVNTGAYSTAAVTLTIGTNPAGASLRDASIMTIPSIVLPAVAGVATFNAPNQIQIDKPGTGFQLNAAATLSAGAVNQLSSAFNIENGRAEVISVDNTPVDFSVQNGRISWIGVTLYDSLGNVCTTCDAGNIAVSETGAGALTGTTPLTPADGKVVFQDLVYDAGSELVDFTFAYDQGSSPSVVESVLFYDSVPASQAILRMTQDPDDGTAPVATSSTNPSSDDRGRFVAFQATGDELLTSAPSAFSHIYIVDRDSDDNGLFNEVGAGKVTSELITPAAANGHSVNASISGDGRYVAYESVASNVVGGDTNGASDIFVYDAATGTTIRASVGPSGAQANGGSFNPAISRGGRYVAFDSLATNLVAGDTNSKSDIFVYDMYTGVTSRVSLRNGGTLESVVGGGSYKPVISQEAANVYVAFESDARDLVAGDTNGLRDIFRRQFVGGTATIRVSVTDAGAQLTGGASIEAGMSLDGQFVAFVSGATNAQIGTQDDGTTMINNDNGFNDVFLRDIGASDTYHVSTQNAGADDANGDSRNPVVYYDGVATVIVAFDSAATDIESAATTGRDVFSFVLNTTTDTGSLALVSVIAPATEGDGTSQKATISGGWGEYVIFETTATNLDADVNGVSDIYAQTILGLPAFP